jgi:hypothetical protein
LKTIKMASVSTGGRHAPVHGFLGRACLARDLLSNSKRAAKDHAQNVNHKVFHILAHGIHSLLAGLTSGHNHAFSATGNARRFVNERPQPYRGISLLAA